MLREWTDRPREPERGPKVFLVYLAATVIGSVLLMQFLRWLGLF